MMSIGGVIGAGFFLGVGGAINLAGPAVIVAYLIAGIVALLVVMLLSEMAVAMPVAGSFQVYAGIAIHPYVGFLTGWTYWLAFLLGPASEVIAAGTFLHSWFPSFPIWEFCLVVAIAMTMINLVGAHFFGEVEFWLSLLKVIALLGFIVMGVVVMSVFHHSAISLQTVTTYHGFVPHGITGVFSAMLLVILSYGGTESIGTAAEETNDPQKNMPRALKGTALRIVILYIVSIGVLLAVLPWSQAGLSASPFVEAFKILGGQRFGVILGNIMNFVVLTAALSCIDTGIFATSRMLFSLASYDYFPKSLTKLYGTRKVPRNAIIASSSVLFVGVLASIYLPNAYIWVGSLAGFGFLFSWLMIAVSQPNIRKMIQKTDSSSLKWKTPFYPYSQYLAVILMLAIFVGEFFTHDGREILLSGCIWFIFASVYYCIVRYRLKKHKL